MHTHQTAFSHARNMATKRNEWSPKTCFNECVFLMTFLPGQGPNFTCDPKFLAPFSPPGDYLLSLWTHLPGSPDSRLSGGRREVMVIRSLSLQVPRGHRLPQLNQGETVVRLGINGEDGQFDLVGLDGRVQGQFGGCLPVSGQGHCVSLAARDFDLYLLVFGFYCERNKSLVQNRHQLKRENACKMSENSYERKHSFAHLGGGGSLNLTCK